MSEKNEEISMQSIIKAKKQGLELSEEMIKFYIDGVVSSQIPDY